MFPLSGSSPGALRGVITGYKTAGGICSPLAEWQGILVCYSSRSTTCLLLKSDMDYKHVSFFFFSFPHYISKKPQCLAGRMMEEAAPGIWHPAGTRGEPQRLGRWWKRYQKARRCRTTRSWAEGSVDEWHFEPIGKKWKREKSEACICLHFGV